MFTLCTISLYSRENEFKALLNDVTDKVGKCKNVSYLYHTCISLDAHKLFIEQPVKPVPVYKYHEKMHLRHSVSYSYIFHNINCAMIFATHL